MLPARRSFRPVRLRPRRRRHMRRPSGLRRLRRELRRWCRRPGVASPHAATPRLWCGPAPRPVAGALALAITAAALLPAATAGAAEVPGRPRGTRLRPAGLGAHRRPLPATGRALRRRQPRPRVRHRARRPGAGQRRRDRRLRRARGRRAARHPAPRRRRADVLFVPRCRRRRARSMGPGRRSGRNRRRSAALRGSIGGRLLRPCVTVHRRRGRGRAAAVRDPSGQHTGGRGTRRSRSWRSAAAGVSASRGSVPPWDGCTTAPAPLSPTPPS